MDRLVEPRPPFDYQIAGRPERCCGEDESDCGPARRCFALLVTRYYGRAGPISEFGPRDAVRRIVQKAGQLAVMLPRAATTSLYQVFGRSDYRRWVDAGNLEAWWDSRTQKLASLVPAGSRTLEFGAGRRQLERFLPSDCVYFASDLTDRGPGTIVCDLNARPLPDLSGIRIDTVVFGGVIEYIRDVPSLARWLNGQTSAIVMSYDCTMAQRPSPRRLWEWLRRSSFGYMSHYTLDELTAVFQGAGFHRVKVDAWQNQKLLVFSSTSTAVH